MRNPEYHFLEDLPTAAIYRILQTHTSISYWRVYFCANKFPNCSKNVLSFSRSAASIWRCSSSMAFMKSCCVFCASSSTFIWISLAVLTTICSRSFWISTNFFSSGFRLHFSEFSLVISRGSLLQLISLFFVYQKISQELKKQKFIQAIHFGPMVQLCWN